MIKKLAIPTANGTFFVITDEPNVIAADPATQQALNDAWALYNRSAGVYLDDIRVFIDQQEGQIVFSYNLTLFDAAPWRTFIGATNTGGGGGIDTHGPYTLSHLYRFVLVNPQTGVADTGANYPSCSIDNKPACQPIQFANLADAIDYAYEHGETPYRVMTSDETWGLIDGTLQEDQSRILPPNQHAGPGSTDTGLSTGLLLVGAGILALLFGRRRSE